MTKKPLILITNDDSISAPGIKVLTEIANDFGEVWVVAPDGPMSGKGHAISLDVSLRVTEVKNDGLKKNIRLVEPPQIV